MRLSLVLIVAMVAAACAPADGDYDWCYRYDFGQQVFADFYFQDTGNQYLHTPTTDSAQGGLVSVADVDFPGQIVLRPFSVTPFDVNFAAVAVSISPVLDHPTDTVPVVSSPSDPIVGSFYANIHGYEISQANISSVFLGAINGVTIEPVGTYTPTDSIEFILYSDYAVQMNYVEVYGFGENPFGFSNCGGFETGPTSTPIPLPTQPPGSTPQATQTGVPGCAAIQFDFGAGRRGFSGTTYGSYSAGFTYTGFVSANTQIFPRRRALNLSRDFTLDDVPTPSRISAVEVRYYAQPGVGAEPLELLINGAVVGTHTLVSGAGSYIWSGTLRDWDQIEIDAVVGQSTNFIDPGGVLIVREIIVYVDLITIIPTGGVPYFEALINCNDLNLPAPTATASPTPTPTPTGTLAQCWRMDLDFTNPALGYLGDYEQEVSGVSNTEFNPNNFTWDRFINLEDGSDQFNGLSIVRVEIDIEEYTAGTNASDFRLVFRSVNNPYPEFDALTIAPGSVSPGTIVYTSSTPVNTRLMRVLAVVGEATDFPVTDPGGSITISAMRVWGVGNLPSDQWVGSDFIGSTCIDITPTPTLPVTNTNTPFPSATASVTPTITQTASRTPLPTFVSPTPTRTLIPTLTPTNTPPPTNTTTPTRTATATRTLVPTFTPRPPSLTPLPSATALPTVTPDPSLPPVTVSSTPTRYPTIAPPDFGTLPPMPLATLPAEPDDAFGVLPTYDALEQFWPQVEGGLSTAQAQVNELPSDVTSLLPVPGENLYIFAGYVRYVTTGVIVQEALGEKLAPIGEHALYSFYVVIFFGLIHISLNVIVFILKIVLWMIAKIRSILP
ncbi:MAG: hypothetical protein MUF38_01460 [Anaerolineae bacterium]|nr:hypothetical protein [Anaerolineae bacterium]